MANSVAITIRSNHNKGPENTDELTFVLFTSLHDQMEASAPVAQQGFISTYSQCE